MEEVIGLGGQASYVMCPSSLIFYPAVLLETVDGGYSVDCLKGCLGTHQVDKMHANMHILQAQFPCSFKDQAGWKQRAM